ncbi:MULTISPECIES: DUF896 family protein [Enterococcus]|uniref:UPF0291 protein A6E74_03815 n=3 Tax=root TaxID=1 RepID=A0A179ETK5_ENTTH|nr:MULTISPECIES: DUF896 family protein [Enterococcus]ASZ07708.1 hypothetical protein CK496_07225 [Enterococcus thailandicus]MBO0431423.1 DUF896 family protein [Enterococcus sp. DIV0660C]MBO0482372.1 DUF896 family protein [Enterococcus sp. MSG2901]MDA3965648.1 DUF896 family protein [Enterococcus thailandicus]MDA3972458.1 DUF896 family protein [Enterococcus thailandicus]
MLSPEKIARINELAKKKKAEGLSKEEEKEQILLREEYLTAFRSGMRHHIEGMKIVDPEGNDVTPDKLKEIQKEKGLHDR